MKAIDHPEHGLMLVADDVPTDPTVTLSFVDSDPPFTAPGEVALASLQRDGNIVRRMWSVSVVGYPIPVGDLFRELTDQELQSICALILTGPEQSRVPTFTFLCRAMAQTELSSIDPRVIAARSAFGPLLGDDRIAHLFRQR